MSLRKLLYEVCRNMRHSARPAVALPRDRREDEKGASSYAKKQAYDPEGTSSCKRRDRCNRNCDLKHCHTAREYFVLVKVYFRSSFLVFGFGFYLFLLSIVACGFSPIFWQWRARQRDFCFEH